MMWSSDHYYFSIDESLIAHETELAVPEASRPAAVLDLFASVRDLPVVQYDTYKDFVEYERQPDHLPLYVNPGTHFNPRGNAFLGERLARFLLDSSLVR